MTGSDESSEAGESTGDITADPRVEPGGEREGDRIAKLLARAGVASRREIERMIEDRRIALDGQPITTPATLLTSLRGVTVDGRPVAKPERTRLFRFHKPPGLLTAERDPAGRATIYDALRNALPPGTPRVMPIGRLDLNTEGLLLLTNDGEFKRLLELPANGVPRTYRARTFGEISQAQLEDLMDGVTVEGVNYGRIDANLERSTGRNQWIEMTLSEGKNREVRRVLEHLGLQVSRLIRTSYGPFALGDLRPGGAEEVRREDLERFRSGIKGPPGSREPREAFTTAEGEPAARLSRPPRTAPPAARVSVAGVRARPAPAGEGTHEKTKPPRRRPGPGGSNEARDRAAFSAEGPRSSRKLSIARAERAPSGEARGRPDRRPDRAAPQPGGRRDGGGGRERAGADGQVPRSFRKPSTGRSDDAATGGACGRQDGRRDRAPARQGGRNDGGAGRERAGGEGQASRSFQKPAAARSDRAATGELRDRQNHRAGQGPPKPGGRRDSGPSTGGRNAPDRDDPRRGPSSPASGRPRPSGPRGGRK